MSNLDKKLDEILDDVLIGMFCRDPEGDFVPLDDAKNVLRSQAKQAIKQLVADEMREADEMRAILRGLSEELQEMKKLGRKYMRISDLEYSINKSIVLHERAKLKEVK